MIKLAPDSEAGLLDESPAWALVISKLRFHSRLLFGLGRARLQSLLSLLVSSTAPPFPPSSAAQDACPHWCSSPVFIPLPYLYCSPPPDKLSFLLRYQEGILFHLNLCH